MPGVHAGATSRFQARRRLGRAPSHQPSPRPRPAPCCRTRRWQARWCSCPRTSPPPSCQPAADPTSAGRSWPLQGIGAAAPAAEKRTGLLLSSQRRQPQPRWLYAQRDSRRMWRFLSRPPSAPLRLLDVTRSQTPPPLRPRWEHAGSAGGPPSASGWYVRWRGRREAAPGA